MREQCVANSTSATSALSFEWTRKLFHDPFPLPAVNEVCVGVDPSHNFQSDVLCPNCALFSGLVGCFLSFRCALTRFCQMLMQVPMPCYGGGGDLGPCPVPP